MSAFVVIEGGQGSPLQEGRRSIATNRLAEWPVIAAYIGTASLVHTEGRPYAPTITLRHLNVLVDVLEQALSRRGFRDTKICAAVLERRWSAHALLQHREDRQLLEEDCDALRRALADVGVCQQESICRTLAGTFTVAWVSAANATPPSARIGTRHVSHTR